jgi:SulP family sulfate permease
VLFALGSPADDIYLLECGAVNCRVDFTLTTVHSRAQLPALPPDLQPQHAERCFTYGPGSIVGELDFFLQRPRRWGRQVAARVASAWGQRHCQRAGDGKDGQAPEGVPATGHPASCFAMLLLL